MIKSKIKNNDLVHLTVLFLLLSTGFFTFSRYLGAPYIQLQIAIITASAYFFWGIFHHLYHHDLNWKIVVEYVSIAIVGVSMLWILLAYIS